MMHLSIAVKITANVTTTNQLNMEWIDIQTVTERLKKVSFVNGNPSNAIAWKFAADFSN